MASETSAPVGKKWITAEGFFRMPDPMDGSRQELVRGEVITMPPPGGLHGVSCSRVDRRLGTFAEVNNLGTVAANNTGFILARDPDTVRVPDVAFWSWERLPEIPLGYIEMSPDLAVEVLSPSNTSKQIRAKVEEYFARGVRLVWVVAPEDRTVTIYRSPEEGRVLHESATITGEDVLPGFQCEVRDLLP